MAALKQMDSARLTVRRPVLSLLVPGMCCDNAATCLYNPLIISLASDAYSKVNYHMHTVGQSCIESKAERKAYCVLGLHESSAVRFLKELVPIGSFIHGLEKARGWPDCVASAPCGCKDIIELSIKSPLAVPETPIQKHPLHQLKIAC